MPIFSREQLINFNNMAEYFGGIEAGGTKFVCAIGDENYELLESVRIPTENPKDTVDKSISFFTNLADKYPLSSIGIGSFGPVDLDVNSETYGFITSTAKPGWQNVNFGKYVKEKLNIPLGFDTDVNAAALAEHLNGAAKSLDTFVYLTIGTGIGGGVMANGKLLHGLGHPEIGHSFIPKDARDDYKGMCPFHRNMCFEGLASGPAIEERWGASGDQLHDKHEVWDLEAYYIALGLVNCITFFSPKKIILGGSVTAQEQLFPLIRTNVQKLLNGYINLSAITENIDGYIVPASFGNDTGILGALALAKNALSSNTE